MMILHLVLYAVLIVRGRWQALTRRIDIGLLLLTCGVLAWCMAVGAIFAAEPTDQIVKGALVLIILGTLIDTGLKLRRELDKVIRPA
ncbi:hypothetical protein ACIBH1_40635 [Nonomuraea sp. NPDC050663]|uniref:hypothetical protein n=1 Tax=Nonomuraea sp. NPDC050663 TaxID=3364370 RepID=UPI0037A58F38